MAYTSGSQSKAITSYCSTRFSWSEDSYNVANNTSVVSWKVEVVSTSRISASATKSVSVTVNGTSYSGSHAGISIPSGGGSVTMFSGTTTIAHNNDGSKTFSWSYKCEINCYLSNVLYEYSQDSGTGVLTTIPRATTPTLSASSVDLGTAVTISLSGRAMSSFTHTLTYRIGTASGTIATKTTATSVSFTPATSLGTQIPNSASGAVVITCETFNGSTSVGTKTVNLTVTAPASWKPSIGEIKWVIGSGYVFGSNIIAQNVNGLEVYADVGLENLNGASLARWTVTVNGKTYTDSTNLNPQGTPILTDPITASGTMALTVSAIDSRGRSATGSTNITVTAYSTPAVTLAVHRTDSAGHYSESGDYGLVEVTGTIDTISGNSGTVTVTVSIPGQSDIVRTDTVSSGTLSQSYLIAVPNSSTASIVAVVADKASSVTRTAALSVGYETMSFLGFDNGNVAHAGRGVAFGHAAYRDGLDVDMAAYFQSAELSSENGILGIGPVNGTIGGYVVMPEMEENGNANDLAYTKPGAWRVRSDGVASGISNLPIARGGRFCCYNLLTDVTTPMVSGEAYRYRTQVYIPYNYPSAAIYVRLVQSNASGVISFGSWSAI